MDKTVIKIIILSIITCLMITVLLMLSNKNKNYEVSVQAIIDRFEGDYAVMELEDKEFVGMPRKLIPEGAKEGEVIKVMIYDEGRKSIKKRTEALLRYLWK